MPIKEKRHPDGMIDMRIVPFSAVADESVKTRYGIKHNHYVLVVDLGDYE